jgi:hypothetical protein
LFPGVIAGDASTWCNSTTLNYYKEKETSISFKKCPKTIVFMKNPPTIVYAAQYAA